MPAGILTYAIGDIHGRADLLSELLVELRADAAAAPSSMRRIIVFLGDYIDRGPDSGKVIDLILDLGKGEEFEVRALKGNHEEALLTFLKDPTGGAAWIQHGGAETLGAYGVAVPRLRTDMEGWAEARDQLVLAMPQSHLAFFQSLDIVFELGDYFFVHAGVRPHIPLDQQSEHDLLWIREEFLDASPSWRKVIVHGHTPMPEPVLSPLRIGLDTGAYATGRLSAIRLVDIDRRIIQVRSGGPGRALRAI